MSKENPLQQAHALSAEASALLRPTNASRASLNAAASAYRKAAELFESSAAAPGVSDDESARKTLQLLMTQHRKLAKDVERRISALPPKSSPSQRPTVELGRGPSEGRDPTSSSSSAARLGSGGSRRASEPVVTGTLGSRRLDGMTLGLSGLGRGWTANPGFASRLSPSRGLPPFAMRPTPSVPVPSAPSNSTPGALSPGPFGRPTVTSRPSTIHATSHDPAPSTNPYLHATLSPIQSLSSSGSTSESYIHPYGDPSSSTLDPFSRFWRKLDDMMENISNPVAFAKAVVTMPDAGADAAQGLAEATAAGEPERPRPPRRRDSERDKASTKERDKEPEAAKDRAEKGNVRAFSPLDSYYLVPKSNDRKPSADGPRNASPSAKTPEELSLENDSLRASLDALAVHTQRVEQENRALLKGGEERDQALRNVAEGVRREARKAKQGQDLLRSQMLASAISLDPGRADGSPKAAGDESALVFSLRKKIRDLEEESKALRADNDKHRAHVQKYKDRFERIKLNARAKREAEWSALDQNQTVLDEAEKSGV